jgi:hypothetical protein
VAERFSPNQPKTSKYSTLRNFDGSITESVLESPFARYNMNRSHTACKKNKKGMQDCTTRVLDEDDHHEFQHVTTIIAIIVGAATNAAITASVALERYKSNLEISQDVTENSTTQPSPAHGWRL